MQKYHKGDHVRVAKDLGKCMSHFASDCDAIVIGSYVDQFGGNRTDTSYTIHIKGKGETSWYYEHQLEFIEEGRIDLLDRWEEERLEEIEIKSDLDWIFSNGNDVLKNPHGASVQALAACFGMKNLWGSHGEGIDYCMNSLRTQELAKPFLKTGDKEGWLTLCKTIRAKCEA